VQSFSLSVTSLNLASLCKRSCLRRTLLGVHETLCHMGVMIPHSEGEGELEQFCQLWTHRISWEWLKLEGDEGGVTWPTFNYWTPHISQEWVKLHSHVHAECAAHSMQPLPIYFGVLYYLVTRGRRCGHLNIIPSYYSLNSELYQFHINVYYTLHFTTVTA